MIRHLVVAACVIAASSAVWTMRTSAMAPGEETDQFEGKLVLVYFKGRTADHAFMLEKAQFNELNGVKTLVGVHAERGDDVEWMSGRTAIIAFDAVESLTLYESVEDYEEAVAPYSDDAL
jgi:hypothetical protein